MNHIHGYAAAIFTNSLISNPSKEDNLTSDGFKEILCVNHKAFYVRVEIKLHLLNIHFGGNNNTRELGIQ